MTKPLLACLIMVLFIVHSVSAQEVRLNPLHTPGIEFLRDPTPAVDSEAKTQAEMKPYIETITGTSVTFQMVPVPGGKFLMGSPAGEKGREDHEGPQVEVEFSPFGWRNTRSPGRNFRSSHGTYFVTAAVMIPTALFAKSLPTPWVVQPRLMTSTQSVTASQTGWITRPVA